MSIAKKGCDKFTPEMRSLFKKATANKRSHYTIKVVSWRRFVHFQVRVFVLVLVGLLASNSRALFVSLQLQLGGYWEKMAYVDLIENLGTEETTNIFQQIVESCKTRFWIYFAPLSKCHWAIGQAIRAECC